MCEFCQPGAEHDPVVAEIVARAQRNEYYAQPQPQKSAFMQGFNGCFGVGCAFFAVGAFVWFLLVVVVAFGR